MFDWVQTNRIIYLFFNAINNNNNDTIIMWHSNNFYNKKSNNIHFLYTNCYVVLLTTVGNVTFADNIIFHCWLIHHIPSNTIRWLETYNKSINVGVVKIRCFINLF